MYGQTRVNCMYSSALFSSGAEPMSIAQNDLDAVIKISQGLEFNEVICLDFKAEF